MRTFTRAHLAEHGTQPTRAEIAAATGLKPERLDDLQQWLAPVRSLDAPAETLDGECDALHETIAAPAGHDSEAAALAAAALEAIRAADADGAALLELIAEGGPITAVAEAAGLGRHRVRQVQREAVSRLRELPEVAAALAAA